MLEMENYDEPDPDSDLDYEESYTKRRRSRKGSGRVIKVLSVCNVRFLKNFLWFRRDLVMTHQALQDVREVLDEAAAKKQDLEAIIMNLHQEILINHLLVNVSFCCHWVFGLNN